MIDIIFKISGAIIVLNAVILLVPHGKFEKYISLITGLLIILIVLSVFWDISYDIDFNIAYNNLSYDSTDLEKELQSSLENDLEQRYLSDTNFKDSIKDIDVKLENETISVKIKLVKSEHKEEIINEVSTFYDIKKAFVVIE